MDQTLCRLKNWGCDIDGAMARVLNDEELLLSCIRQVAEDPCFEQLGKALKAGNAEEAFDAAHTLKGIAGNTGLTPLYALAVEIVEPLRAGHAQGLMPAYGRLLSDRDKLRQLLAEQ